MKLLMYLLFLMLPAMASAEVQVPENCIKDQVSPCLLRANEEFYRFQFGTNEVRIAPKTIVKMTAEVHQLNFEILTGSVEIKAKAGSVQGAVAVNDILLAGDWVMAKRKGEQLRIFNLNSFALTQYQYQDMGQGTGVFKRSNGALVTKLELVLFTKDFFTKVGDFKSFLNLVEEPWAAEFKKQNESQTKALLRSVASEEKDVEDRLRKKEREAAELKKTKNEFFFRTFQR